MHGPTNVKTDGVVDKSQIKVKNIQKIFFTNMRYSDTSANEDDSFRNHIH
jgi:hypothetical protein